MGVRLYVQNVTLVLERLPEEATGEGNSDRDGISEVDGFYQSVLILFDLSFVYPWHRSSSPGAVAGWRRDSPQRGWSRGSSGLF